MLFSRDPNIFYCDKLGHLLDLTKIYVYTDRRGMLNKLRTRMIPSNDFYQAGLDLLMPQHALR